MAYLCDFVRILLLCYVIHATFNSYKDWHYLFNCCYEHHGLFHLSWWE